MVSWILVDTSKVLQCIAILVTDLFNEALSETVCDFHDIIPCVTLSTGNTSLHIYSLNWVHRHDGLTSTDFIVPTLGPLPRW
jgi:hypothetical protein